MCQDKKLKPESGAERYQRHRLFPLNTLFAVYALQTCKTILTLKKSQ